MTFVKKLASSVIFITLVVFNLAYCSKSIYDLPNEKQKNLIGGWSGLNGKSLCIWIFKENGDFIEIIGTEAQPIEVQPISKYKFIDSSHFEITNGIPRQVEMQMFEQTGLLRQKVILNQKLMLTGNIVTVELTKMTVAELKKIEFLFSKENVNAREVQPTSNHNERKVQLLSLPKSIFEIIGMILAGIFGLIFIGILIHAGSEASSISGAEFLNRYRYYNASGVADQERELNIQEHGNYLLNWGKIAFWVLVVWLFLYANCSY